MKYIKSYENIPSDKLPIENSKFKIGDEVIYVGDPIFLYDIDEHLKIGEKCKILEVFSTIYIYYYILEINGYRVRRFIQEKDLIYEYEWNANKYNL